MAARRKKWKMPNILPDIKDVLLFGGLGMVGYGVWHIYPPSAMILVGGILFTIGVYWYHGGK
jgi:hypothetical protein